jgi:hypothetical protein
MSVPRPCQQLTRMITSYWVSRAMYIAATTGLRRADPSAHKIVRAHGNFLKKCLVRGGMAITQHSECVSAEGGSLQWSIRGAARPPSDPWHVVRIHSISRRESGGYFSHRTGSTANTNVII